MSNAKCVSVIELCYESYNGRRHFNASLACSNSVAYIKMIVKSRESSLRHCTSTLVGPANAGTDAFSGLEMVKGGFWAQ